MEIYLPFLTCVTGAGSVLVSFFSIARGEHKKAEGGGGGLCHLPFTWKNRKFPLENQVVRAIFPFLNLKNI